jgi:hypothetical protein
VDPKRLEELLDEIVKQLERVRSASLPKHARAIMRRTIQLAEDPPLEVVAVRLPEPNPRKARNVRQHWAANQVFGWFAMWSEKPPTISANESPYYIASQLLNEAVGGNPDADMTNACRAVLVTRKEQLQLRWSSRALRSD